MAFTKDDVLPELRWIMRRLGGADAVSRRSVPDSARVSYLQVQAVNMREVGDVEALNAVREAKGALSRGDEQAAYEAIRDEVIRREPAQ
jgi:hypothetical protein